MIKGASTSNRPHLKGSFSLDGTYTVVTGFEVSGNGAFRIRGNFNRVTRNYIHDFGVSPISFSEARSNRADHNEIARMLPNIMDNAAYGIFLAAGSGQDSTHAKDNRVDHNYLHDFPDQPNNGHSAMQFGSGDSTIYDARTLVDNNLIVSCNGDSETVGFKTSSNSFIGNTVLKSKSYVSNRHGHDNIYKNNWVETVKGFGIRGRARSSSAITRRTAYASLRGIFHRPILTLASKTATAATPISPLRKIRSLSAILAAQFLSAK